MSFISSNILTLILLVGFSVVALHITTRYFSNFNSYFQTDFGFVGCSSDVLHLADKRCSGRHSCIINVPDALFENTKPCNEEFKFYLEATYTCRKGTYCLIDIQPPCHFHEIQDKLNAS